MRYFKLPLIVTGIALVLVMALGIAGAIWIAESSGTGREKEARAQMLGAGAATLLCVVVAPFWLFAAAKVGKERRAAKLAATRPVPRSTRATSSPMPPRRK